jgi:hypothetical protein
MEFVDKVALYVVPDRLLRNNHLYYARVSLLYGGGHPKLSGPWRNL